MKMSLFRQGQDQPEQADHLDCMKIAATMDDSDMVLHARLNDATMLVGLETGEVAVKRAKEGDEALRFEDLYDTAITQHEFLLMRQQKVRLREALAPEHFELRLMIHPPEVPIRFGLRVKAKGQYDVQALIKRLVREDTDFGTELSKRCISALMRSFDDAVIETTGALRINRVAPADAPQWEFVDDHDD